jgi:type II secretory pathway component GspD/PulD (secretin)
VDLQIIDVSHTDAGAVARTVQAMLADRSRWPEDLLAAERAGLGVPTPTVNADVRANRLVLSAPGALMPLARDLIAALDRPASQGTVEVRVFALGKSEAEPVASALRTALAAGVTPGEPVPTVTAEPGSNSVVVAASADRLKQAESIIKELDTSTKPDGVAVRTVMLRHARAETVAPLVETLLTRESVLDQIAPWQKFDYLRTQKSEAPPVRVAAEPRLNAVVVTGPAGIIEIAEQVITELDVEPGDGGGGGRSVRVLPLNHADANEVSTNVQAVFADEATGEVPPTVRVDRGSNSLIIRATDAQMKTIEGLVNSIDGATLTTSRDLRLIPIDRSSSAATRKLRSSPLRTCLRDPPRHPEPLIAAAAMRGLFNPATSSSTRPGTPAASTPR